MEKSMKQSISPVRILKDAIKAVPAVRYALGISGILAVVAISFSFRLDPRIAVFGALIMLILMTALVIFARLTVLPESSISRPAIVFTWFALLLVMATAVALFASVFFRTPVDLQYWIKPTPSSDNGGGGSIKNPAFSGQPSNPPIDTSKASEKVSIGEPRQIGPQQATEQRSSKLSEEHPLPAERERGAIAVRQEKFDGLLNMEKYCRKELSLAFGGASGTEFSCGLGSASRLISVSDACFAWFGSVAFSGEPTNLSVLCDTSARTTPPCKEDERPCPSDQGYCCPLSHSSNPPK
jgi:hypothetical protein